MFKIQVLNAVAAAGLDEFPRQLYEVSSDIQQPDVMLVRSKSLHEMVITDNILAIGRAGAGVDNIPVAEMTKKGVPVFNTPGANANAVCELVIAGMLMASRNLCRAWDYVNHLNADEAEWNKTIEQNKKQFAGFELMGKTLGIIGLGSIGVKVANVAVSLGMTVIGHDPTITVNRAWELSANVKQARSIDDLLAQSDFVSIHVPFMPDTKHMINAKALQLMKQHAILLNFSRDGIVDDEAVLTALQAGKMAAYVTDFPSKFLQHQPNVISLPHLGASTREAEENCAVMIAKQLRHFLEQGTITNSVNFPSVEAGPFHPGKRLAVINQNVPNMVAQISSTLAENDLNILSLVNQSKGDIAYTLIDVDQDIKEAVINKITCIDGVLKTRRIGQDH